MNNYKKLTNGIIKQININKIEYNFDYSNKYNSYGEKSNYLANLRLGVLLGAINKTPDSILDIGYGNGDFLKACSNIIPKCYGSDLHNDIKLLKPIQFVEDIFANKYDVITFFDSLEHFDDIFIIDKLKTKYIMISLPWCHNFSDEWFINWYHRRENEHLWHFNDKSLIQFFQEYDYELIYMSNFEDAIRKNSTAKDYPNILSAVFKKK